MIQADDSTVLHAKNRQVGLVWFSRRSENVDSATFTKIREDLPMPLLGLGEALVRLSAGRQLRNKRSGARGDFLPFRGTLGHEFVSVVVEAADAHPPCGSAC